MKLFGMKKESQQEVTHLVNQLIVRQRKSDLKPPEFLLHMFVNLKLEVEQLRRELKEKK